MSAPPPAAHHQPWTPYVSRPNRPLHLAAAVDGTGPCGPEPEHTRYYTELARLAECGTLDFITLDDSLRPPGADGVRVDALSVLARVAPATNRIGLVPTVTTPHTEPFRVSAGLAALDRLSGGRAGRTVRVSATRHAGQRSVAPPEALWREAGEIAAVAPPPHGHPVVAVDATATESREFAARHADVVHVRADDPDTAGGVRTELRARAAAAGRDPDRLTVLASVGVELLCSADGVGLAELIGEWYRDGAADGFHIRPSDAVRDLRRLVDCTVPLLQQRGLLRHFYPGDTLREHLGIARPVWKS